MNSLRQQLVRHHDRVDEADPARFVRPTVRPVSAKPATAGPTAKRMISNGVTGNGTSASVASSLIAIVSVES